MHAMVKKNVEKKVEHENEGKKDRYKRENQRGEERKAPG